ncbi:D-isomer specific 2-hydroxyacid dehydrogenase, NAD binding domain protein [Pseudomonas fluorescens]|uniref:D-isomer specific 2-hydroxyacid dehydrogenase, NAD binding domain protein n=1 Tax=Pseudomonas fluorescens TaxID=294 RepID=A0A0P9B0U4_PSEFL|nr:glyoxylate/hydroxypyruvate reductase A [Pseudomonas fluorescens]KPU56042.1 D-isomer specific 2-hydroxyacid dehydrogenase, NAD binding domain protein [Pseudomonas fluorescens]
MALLYKADPVRGEQWKRLFAEHAPDIEWRAWPDIGDPKDIRYLAAWQAPDDLETLLPNLQVLFALSAGVDQLDLDRLPTTLPVVRLLDPSITLGMCEYASFAVLGLHRDMLRYRQQQMARCWQAHLLQPAAKRRVGVMGLGTQAQQILATLRTFGFVLSGWARSEHRIAGVDCFAGAEQLPVFLGQCDIVVCVLPLTEQTKGILNRQLFQHLPKGAALVNMGRGGHLIEEDLLEALATGQLSAAVLDVLQQEPAAPDHPFWHHPQILLTPHIAAMTQPESAFSVLLENIRRHQRGESMLGQVDRERSY